jgi:hypothetical protein
MSAALTTQSDNQAWDRIHSDGFGQVRIAARPVAVAEFFDMAFRDLVFGTAATSGRASGTFATHINSQPMEKFAQFVHSDPTQIGWLSLQCDPWWMRAPLTGLLGNAWPAGAQTAQRHDQTITVVVDAGFRFLAPTGGPDDYDEWLMALGQPNALLGDRWPSIVGQLGPSGAKAAGSLRSREWALVVPQKGESDEQGLAGASIVDDTTVDQTAALPASITLRPAQANHMLIAQSPLAPLVQKVNEARLSLSQPIAERLWNFVQQLAEDESDFTDEGVVPRVAALDGLISFLANHSQARLPRLTMTREGAFAAIWDKQQEARIRLDFLDSTKVRWVIVSNDTSVATGSGEAIQTALDAIIEAHSANEWMTT